MHAFVRYQVFAIKHSDTENVTTVQEILEVEQLMGEEDTGLELTAENVEKSLDEIR